MKQQKHQGKSLSGSPWETARLRLAAARFHLVETLAGQKIWQDGMAWRRRWFFWMTLAGMTGEHAPDTTGTWMPGLAAAIRQESDLGVLGALSDFPLPDPLPTPLEPFRAFMMEIWANHPAAHDDPMSLAARVRLDSLGGEQGGAHLATWLAMARHVLSSGGTDQEIRLGCLARWRPGTASRPDPKALARWNAFWNVYGKGFDANPVIAIQARLNLAGSRSSIPTSEAAKLLNELAELIHEADSPEFREVPPLSQWLIWQPRATTPLPPGGLRRVARAWLEKTNPSEYTADTRQIAWTILTSWDREGLLARSGIDLGPELARTLEGEQDGEVLRAMAGYIPGAVEVSAHPEAMRAIIARWEALSQSDNWLIRQTAWVARWNLRRAGVLTAGEQARFDADDVEAIGAENNGDVLLALARITPPGTFPLAIWTRRLSDQNDRCRLAAQLAIHGWLVDMTGGGQRRQVRQVLRRAGQNIGDGTVAPFVNLPPEVWPDFRRLRGIETALAAGHLPPPPDAAAENRATPRAVPARLPGAHPRTGPPGITDRTTGRTAGSDPQARHPVPEVIRHE